MSDKDASGQKLHIAIVGSGPSGFYAAEALLRSDRDVRIDMIERLPTPYGLVRSGVAPDHPKLKQSIAVYDGIARNENFRFFGNVAAGRDISIAELQQTHHAVLLACGAHEDRTLTIPGAGLRGNHSATEFVGWYNGHPDFRDRTFDLSHETAVILGQGNVAADVCRILAKPVDELRTSDIAEHALNVLAESKIREIHVVGRRGPAHAKFTAKELRELGEIVDVSAHARPEDCALNEESRLELKDKANFNAAKNLEHFTKFANPVETIGQRKIQFRFCLSPVALLGEDHVEGISFVRNRLEGPLFSQKASATDQTETISCGLVLRSIGYRGVPLDGVPFDSVRGVVPNVAGRVVDGKDPRRGLYVTGWLKRGPTGIIGTNRADSIETVENLLADASEEEAKSGADALLPLLEERVRWVSFAEWLKIDAAEIERGKDKGKPREKFTKIDEMLKLLV
jgi:ferredoxin--NADP+ reductase